MQTKPPDSHHTVGELIRRYRNIAGLSQEALAERAGLSPRGLLYLERGMRQPYPATLRRLADALSLGTQEREGLALAARHGAADVPPAPAVDAGAAGTLHNLPVSLSSFIGREQAQAAVHELLASHRLVTLVGAGGVGKTRLALAVAEGSLNRYPDGVWLVELAALADPELVPGAVAKTLGLREEPGRPILETLSASCGGRRMMLVLDNCEHLLAACAALAGVLLRAAPEVRILATSREALGIAGERRYRVVPLRVPEPEPEPDPAVAGSYEAVHLFVVRAQERRDTFALTTANTRAAVEICARLDGVPLAIELAAARVAAMSVQMIAAHLHDSVRLLTTGAGDLPARQRTLRSTLDWSWALLDPRERELLSRLAVFAGGWTLEAATAVCGDQETDYWAVVDGLNGLVNCSLVHVEETPDGAVRYGLLETVRQYAGEQLATSGRETATRRGHLAYFLALAEQAVEAFRGAEMGSWIARLEQEHANMQAALTWAHAQARDGEGLQLAAALAPFWEFRGLIAEGRRRLEEMLAVSGQSPSTRARALNAAGFLALRAGDHHAALALYEDSLALRRGLGETRGMAVALNNIGNAHIEMGNYAQAEQAYAQALESFRVAGDDWGVAAVFNNRSVAARGLGEYGRAEALARESVALRQAQNDPRGVAEATNNLAQLAFTQGQYEQAAALFAEGLRVSNEVGDMVRVLEAVEGLAWTAAARGRPRWAARMGAAAEAERKRHGLSQGGPDRALRDTAMQTLRAALGEQALRTALAEGWSMTLSEAIGLARQADSAC